jgi:hypothetical protein
MVIISKRATSHRARPDEGTRLGRQALALREVAELPVKGTGDAAAPRSRSPAPDKRPELC